MWHQDESGRVHTPFEPVVLAATLALILILIVEADTKSAGWLTFAEVANWLTWVVFATELLAVLVSATRKRAALRAHWLDVAIVVLTIPLLGKALAWLRLARFIRLARFGVIVSRALSRATTHFRRLAPSRLDPDGDGRLHRRRCAGCLRKRRLHEPLGRHAAGATSTRASATSPIIKTFTETP